MPGELEVKIDGLDNLKKLFKESPKIVTKNLNTAIKQSIFTLLANARVETPVDQGFLRNAGMVTSFQVLVGLLQNKAPYAQYVHDGTRPHWVPLNAIKGWADRHGVPAFLVQRAIARKGTKARPFFKDSIDASQESIDKFFSQATTNIVEELSN